MRALIDGDILRYEIGFAAETGWRAITEDPEAIPPFDYVEDMLLNRVQNIIHLTNADQRTIYLTSGPTFREQIAVTKPYKGTRKDAKPWHFNNLTVYIRDVMNAVVVTHLEADDAMSIEHISDRDTIICSRDKDLRQVPGWFYSWELGSQPSFGPEEISEVGSLSLLTHTTPSGNQSTKLTGTGFAFFCAQVLMGDPVDNIPGLPKCGPVGAYEALRECTSKDEYMDVVTALYSDHYKGDHEEHLLEQGRLCWMTRRRHPDGSPVLWELDMKE
jgi:5'-3' exonuclease